MSTEGLTRDYFNNLGDPHEYPEEPEHIEVITGYPHCPICHTLLSRRPMPIPPEKHWYCDSSKGGCGTEWEVGELIEALNYKEDSSGGTSET